MELWAFAVMCPDELFEDLKVEPGVLFCLRSENDQHAVGASNPLDPHYLVFVSDSGEVLLNYTQAKRILDLLKKLTIGCIEPDQTATRAFNARTHDGTDMAHYQSLLARAVGAITGKAEERGVESLFHRGGTTLSGSTFQGIDDFEVVAYLILVQNRAGNE